MIITRTPFRITLGGGGTDLPFFYREHGGFVFSMAINRFMFICLNRRSVANRQLVVRYSQVEVVDSIEQIKHPLAREALKLYNIQDAIELTSMADLPGNSGLGSSGAYLVGLLTALRAYTGRGTSAREIANEACHIEIDVLGEPVGKQDQFIAALGGFQTLTIDRNGDVTASPVPVDSGTANELVSKAHIYYTGVLRSATAVLRHQREKAESAVVADRSRVMDSLLAIRQIGYDIHAAFLDRDLDRFGTLMDAHWVQKRQLGAEISLSRIDTLYAEVKQRFGVLGGKIIGAGGGGFVMLYCPARIRELDQFMALQGMPQVSFFPVHQGARVVADLSPGGEFQSVTLA